jgi:hypothetical protein
LIERYYDQWKVGDRIEDEIRRTVTETDNLLFPVMTHNPQPLHIDAEFADHARAVVSAFEANPDAGAIELRGKMIDAAHLKQALRLLSLAEE